MLSPMLLQDAEFDSPRFETLAKKILAGNSILTSLTFNKTGDLWKTFMQWRLKIKDTASTNMYSLQVYPSGYFELFDPGREFKKWALIEIDNTAVLPEGMEVFEFSGGLYAVFVYKGLSTDNRIFNYIFSEWLPQSGYDLDDRPHFELLGEKYKNNDPSSEEKIYIPVKPK